VASDAGEGERTVIVAEEHALVGLISVAEIVRGIEDGDSLTAFREGLHKAAEGFIIRIEGGWGH
jgi:hypothetical protein